MKDTTIEALEGEAITDKPIKEFTVQVLNESWYRRLPFIKKEKERTFTIHKCRVCNMYRAATMANKLPEINGEVNTQEELNYLAFPLIEKHKDDLVYLVACLIQNNDKEPKKSLIKFINTNFTSETLLECIIETLPQIGLQSFILSTLLIKGTSAILATETDASNAVRLD